MTLHTTNIDLKEKSPFRSPIFLVITLTWLFCYNLSIKGYFETPDCVLPIKMLIFLMIPPIAFVIALFTSRNVARWADRADVTTATSLQSWQVMGFTFHISWAFGELPLVFALLSGFGNVATGIYATFATVKASQRHSKWRIYEGRIVYIRSIDFTAAVATGLLSAAGYLKVYEGEIPAHLMTAYPIVMFQIFIAPAFIILHILARRGIAKA